MISPSFECSPDGLRSAVRLRYAVWGNRDPEATAIAYMETCDTDDPTFALRARIQLVIDDIERLTSTPRTPEEGEELRKRIDAAMRAEFTVSGAGA